MCVAINKLVVTLINCAVAVTVTVVDVVRVIVKHVVAVRVTSYWPVDPVQVDVVRKRCTNMRVVIV